MSDIDVEKNGGAHVVDSRSSLDHGVISPTEPKAGYWRNLVDGFKRAEVKEIDTTGLSDAEIQVLLTSRSPLKRQLKNRHLQMIAIGGSIGSGLFIGSGNSFATGGPAAVIIGFALIGIMLFCTMNALGELAVRFPVQGSFALYSTRFLDRSWGFAMGWNYAIQWLFVFPLELIAAAVVIGYWNTDDNGATNVNKAAWVALFYAVIAFINLFGVRGYGEAEFIFSFIKVVTVIGFCIFGIVIAAGGGPHHHYLGAHYWYEPGAFAAGAKGVFSVLVNAAFAFSGTELSGLAAAETQAPHKALPKAIKQVFWRILLFYIVSLCICGMLVPYNDPHLGVTSDGSSSPFVLAIKRAGVSGLPSVMNAVIMIAVLSVANASVYGSSRTLAALAVQKQNLAIFNYIDREGRPIVATVFTLIIGLLCFLSATSKYSEVFNWLLALSGMSSLFTWGSICACHIRFRWGLAYHGHNPDDELLFKAALGTFGSYIGLFINVAIIGLQFWIALYPVGASTPNAEDFFEAYLSVPVVIGFYILGKLIYKDWNKWYVTCAEMDMVAGARDMDLAALKAERDEELARIATKNVFYRVYKFWC